MITAEDTGKPEIGESILDRPREGLDPAVWAKNQDGEYVPTIQASEKINNVIEWAVGSFGITEPVVHITGSIASNSYDDASDIDLHFCSETFKPDDIDQFNKEFRAAFAAEFGPETGSENGFIGVHPIEVYFQTNPFQDMMSVGCYDFTNRKWESGPDVKDTAFDPYSEYFEQDMKYVDKIISDVRNSILGVYERALVIRKSTDEGFKAKQQNKLSSDLSSAKKLFDSIRKSRKVMSEPKSKEDALKKRKDRKWHIADSSFKLLDKFGYTAILKAYSQLDEEGIDDETKLQAIIDAVKDNITGNKMLSDSEKRLFDESESAAGKEKIWIDDIRPAPEGYTWIKSVNDFMQWFGENGGDRIAVIDIDHDAGDYRPEGGDYIRVLDYLEFMGVTDLTVRLHSANPVGVRNMRNIIMKNGWTETDSRLNEEDCVENENAGGIPGMPGWDMRSLRSDILGWLDERIEDYQLEIEVLDIAVHGSRVRGDFRDDSDLDVVVYYRCTGEDDKFAKEDHIYNMLNDEPRCEIDGIAVDFNPIRDEQTGSLEDYMKRDAEYDRRKLSGEPLDEGVREGLSFAVLAGMLAIPGLMPASALADGMRRNYKPGVTVNSKEMKRAMYEASEDKTIYGGMCATNNVNAATHVLYEETKGETPEGRAAVLSVILVRTGGDMQYLLDVLREPGAFSCLNKYKTGWTDDTYRWFYPEKELRNPNNKKIFEECQQLVLKMFYGEFKSTIGNRNSYLNKEKTKKINPKVVGPKGWGTLMKNQKKVDHHWFGYLPEHDPKIVKPGTQITWKKINRQNQIKAGIAKTKYVIQPGDTLSKIAKMHNTSVQTIQTVNKIKDPNKIRPGQTILV